MASDGVPEFEAATLDRASFVPLYYQLQEILKQQIESGRFGPGDALPSEPELCRRFGVSRIVVREALAILEDDRQIVRQRGKGTFVAEPKLDHRAGGLLRLLASPRRDGMTIMVLDVSTPRVEASIRRRLSANGGQILRITTLLSVRGTPIAIGYSYFERARAGWLEALARPGARIPDDVLLEDHGVELAHAEVSIETSQCGQFEADRFRIPHRSAVFLVLATEFARDGDEVAPIEVARVEYRGDLLQFRLEVAPGSGHEMAARLAFSGDL